MGYGIGSFIIPLYTNPYLAIEHKATLNGTANATQYVVATTIQTNLETMTTVETITMYDRETRIEYPYAISGSLVAALSFAFFFYQIKETLYRRQYRAIHQKTFAKDTLDHSISTVDRMKSFLRMINPASCAGGDLSYGIQIFGLVLFYFANCHGGERVISGFIRSFSIDQLNFSNDEASLINTTFWISFTLGRFVFFILARFISIRIIIMIETGMVTIISILLNIFATDNKLAYWIMMQPLGFFLAPLWPSGVGWSDYHVELSGVAMGMFILGGSVGGIVHLRLIGFLYDHVSHRAFLYQVLGYAIFALGVATGLNVIGVRHGSRFDNKKKGDENGYYNKEVSIEKDEKVFEMS